MSASACEKVATPSDHPKKEELEKSDKTLVSSSELQKQNQKKVQQDKLNKQK